MSGLRSCSPGSLARRFFVTSLVVSLLAAGIGRGLVVVFGFSPAGSRLVFPPVFWISTVLLLAGSVVLERARAAVRRERQRSFRRALVAGLAVGALFVGLQGYGLWCLLQQQELVSAQTGAGAFLFMLVFVHAMHFSVALLFLVFVTVCGLAGRYDHEYHWGVTVCAWFWHVLGIVWLGILTAFLIATRW